MSDFKSRRERILQLASGFDNVVVLSPKNLFYLTDFWGGGVGIVRSDSTVVVTSVMEEKRANESGKEVEVIATPSMAERHQAVKRILARGKTLVDESYEQVRGAIADEELFIKARRKKDSEEISRIAEASKRIEKTYRLLEKTIRPGVTEVALAAEVMKLATLEGLSPLAAEGSLSPIIIAAGENAALPHAELTERKLKTGDTVIADIFFRYRGYCSDCTRTYAVGKISKERREAYEAVREAQLRGVELLKSGALGREVHEGVKGVLASHGLERYFTHGTGHGVGIDIHESPSLGGKSEDILQRGDVVTIEPGIYVPDEYGIRIEDTLAIDGGTRNFFSYTKELLVL